MKCTLRIFAAFVVAFILQTGVTGVFPIMGASANLLLCVTTILTFMYHENYSGLVMGALFGLLYDVCFIQYVGVTAICLTVVGALCIVFRSFVLNYESKISGVCVSLGAVLVYYNLFWLILHLCGDRHGYSELLDRMPVYLSVNFVIMMVMYIIVQQMLKKADQPQERRRWY